MSKALECNRCGKCFTPRNMEDDELFIKIDDLIWFNRDGYDKGCVSERYKDLHLCSTCSEMLLYFFNGGAIPALQDTSQQNKFFDRTEVVVRRDRHGQMGDN